MTRKCERCEIERGTISVPDELSEYASKPAISYCPRCLAVESVDAVDDSDVSLSAIHPRFPSGTNGVGLLLLLGKLESLALNRATIESLCDYLESNGLDLFLTLDRLIDDPEIAPEIDLDRRGTQLEGVLS